ncbi:DMT family transporter [Gemmatimonas sp. UBA7669]|uniref:DMT family transporter n=1 Tax=Gemmatimonas sp. UBA7669 TaxID=1946568 RepID=UPI0025C3302B|nr:DMT family transporter [Gemmatimonas sp. UBA7669]
MPQFSTHLALAFAIVAGMVIPVQAGANGRLGRLAGHPLFAALTSLGVSLVVLAVLASAFAPRPDLTATRSAPPWVWLGGFAGAIYVLTATAFAPRLGAATFTAAVVAGQLVAAAVIDHGGLFGFAVRPLSLVRVLGLALVAGGALVLQQSATSK